MTAVATATAMAGCDDGASDRRGQGRWRWQTVDPTAMVPRCHGSCGKRGRGRWRWQWQAADLTEVIGPMARRGLIHDSDRRSGGSDHSSLSAAVEEGEGGSAQLVRHCSGSCGVKSSLSHSTYNKSAQQPPTALLRWQPAWSQSTRCYFIFICCCWHIGNGVKNQCSAIWMWIWIWIWFDLNLDLKMWWVWKCSSFCGYWLIFFAKKLFC